MANITENVLNSGGNSSV